MSKVFQELDKETGIATTVHDLDNKVVIEKSYDAQPLLEEAQTLRTATEGQRWGEWRHVGYIPMAELATMMRQDGTIDMKRAQAWLKKNPALVTFSKFLK